MAEQYDEVAFARHVHEVFTELTMRRATLGEIVDACGQIAESAIVLEDLNRQVVAFTTHGDSPLASSTIGSAVLDSHRYCRKPVRLDRNRG